jgi:DNA-binding transcriptional regulator YiaG
MTAGEFRSIRHALGLTARQVGCIISVHERTARGWEAGARNGKPAPVPYSVVLLMRMLRNHAAVRHGFGITLEP